MTRSERKNGRHRFPDHPSQPHHSTRPARMLQFNSPPRRHEHAHTPSKHPDTEHGDLEHAHFYSDYTHGGGHTGLAPHNQTDMVTGSGIKQQIISIGQNILASVIPEQPQADTTESSCDPQTDQAAPGPPKQTTSKSYKSKSRASSPDEDERRLFGYTGKDPANASRIGVPYSQPAVHTTPSYAMRRAKPGANAGIKPRDNLSRSARGPSKTLEIQRNSGTNVLPTGRGSTRFPDEYQDRMVTTPAKRRKLENSLQDHEDEVTVIEQEAPYAPQSSMAWPGDFNKPAIGHDLDQGKQRSHQKTPRTSSAKKLGGERGIKEYWLVENIMNPSRKPSFTGSQHSQSPIYVDDQKSNVDIQQRNSTFSETPPRTQTNMFAEPHQTKGFSPDVMDKLLRHLESPSVRTDDGAPHHQNIELCKSRSVNRMEHDQQQNKKDYKRRHSRSCEAEMEQDTPRPAKFSPRRKKLKTNQQSDEQDESADELGFDNRVQSRYFEPRACSGLENAQSPTFVAHPVAPGSIQKTIFSRGKKQDFKPASYVDRKGNKSKAPYGLMPLTYYLWSGSKSQLPQKGLGITYNRDSNCFAVEKHTEDKTPKWPYDNIAMERIVKVIMASDGNEVRLSGSSDTDVGQLWYDIAFESSKDMDEFIRIFSDIKSISGIKDSWKKSHVLQKMFKTKQSEVDRRISHGPAIPDDEVHMMEKRVPTSATDVLKDDTTQRNRTTRQKLTSQMQTDNYDQTHVKDAVQRPSRRHQNSFGETVPAPLRATRASNRIAGRSSPTRKAKSPTPTKFSIVKGLGPEWKKPVQFPSTGRAKAIVDFSDLLRLDEGEFLNDNLIGFYMNYAFDKAEMNNSVSSDSVYMFNTFFYSALTQKRASRGIDYAAVSRWTRQVDLFTRDYVVIPINEDFHWYLAIICNLPAINSAVHAESSTRSPKSAQTPEIIESLQDQTAQLQLTEGPSNAVDGTREDTPSEWPDPDENPQASTISPFRQAASATEHHEATTETTGALLHSLPSKSSPRKGKKRKSGAALRKYDPSKPIIVILDSMGSTHFKTTANLKTYIAHEGKAKRNIDADFDHSMTAKGLPEQLNFHDCGIYILAYFEKFLANPKEFIRKVLQREMDPVEDWPDMDPSKLRDTLRELLQALYRQQAQQRHTERAGKSAAKQMSQKADKTEISATPEQKRSPNSEQPTEHADRNEDAPHQPDRPTTSLQEPNDRKTEVGSQKSADHLDRDPAGNIGLDFSENKSREQSPVVDMSALPLSSASGAQDRTRGRASPMVLIDRKSEALGSEALHECQQEPAQQETLFEEQPRPSSPPMNPSAHLSDDSDASLHAAIPDSQASTPARHPLSETQDTATIETQLHIAAGNTPAEPERTHHQSSPVQRSSQQGGKQHVLERRDSDIPVPKDRVAQDAMSEVQLTHQHSQSDGSSTNDKRPSRSPEQRNQKSQRQKIQKQKQYSRRKAASVAPSHPQEIIDLSSDDD